MKATGMICGAFCVLLAVVPSNALRAAESTLDRAALGARVAGNTIRYESSGEIVLEYLAPDGTIHGRSSVHGPYRARWRLYLDDMICFQHDDPMQSGCVAVVLRGSQIEYHRRDGVVEGPFQLLPGNPEGL
jgi:hypothetical protein